jgi:hypothetical protein
MYRINKLLLASILAAGMLFAPKFAHADSNNTLHVVSVGISKYSPESGQRPVPGAHNDAADLAAFWKAQGDARFGRTSVTTLFDSEATRDNILAALDRMVAKAQAGDWAIVALAGHGTLTSRENEWQFAPYDALCPVVMVTGAQLRERLAVLAKRGVLVMLIVDSCHSGELARGDMPCLVLAACQSDQLSSEPENYVHPNGYFTAALLEGMRGAADTNGDGRVTLAELQDYLNRRLAGLVNQQRPAIKLPQGVGVEMALTVQGTQTGPVVTVRR